MKRYVGPGQTKPSSWENPIVFKQPNVKLIGQRPLDWGDSYTLAACVATPNLHL